MHIYDLRNEDGKKLSALVKERPSLVRFHWDSCGHCIQMRPEWVKVQDRVGKSDMYNVIDVELSAMPHVDAELKKGVDGYPMIKAFYNSGKDQSMYEGPRTADEMVAWFKSMKGGRQSNTRRNSKSHKRMRGGKTRRHSKSGRTKRNGKKAYGRRKSRKSGKSRKCRK